MQTNEQVSQCCQKTTESLPTLSVVEVFPFSHQAVDFFCGIFPFSFYSSKEVGVCCSGLLLFWSHFFWSIQEVWSTFESLLGSGVRVWFLVWHQVLRINSVAFLASSRRNMDLINQPGFGRCWFSGPKHFNNNIRPCFNFFPNWKRRMILVATLNPSTNGTLSCCRNIQGLLKHSVPNHADTVFRYRSIFITQVL